MFDEFGLRQFVVLVIICFAEDLPRDVRCLTLRIRFTARFVDRLKRNKMKTLSLIIVFIIITGTFHSLLALEKSLDGQI